MITGHRSRTIAALLLLALLAGPPNPLRGQDASALAEAGIQVTADDVERLVVRLGDEEFALRLQAEQRLREIGRAALPILEAAALQAEPDRVSRITAVLEQMFLNGCPDLADDAERTLERLALSQSVEAGRRARAVLVGNQQLRQRRAIDAIRELGGKVDFVEVSAIQGNVFWGGPGGGSDIEIPGQVPATLRVWLLEDWTGGPGGLWHVARLEDSWSARVWGMEVTNVRGSGLDSADVQALAARLPKVRILERGASLGIQCHPLDPCQIMDIVPEGAAERAGLLPNDIIRRLDDTPIDSFNDLVGELLNRSPNEDVTLQVDRYGHRLQVEVTLGGWRNLVTGHDEPPEPEPLEPLFDRGPLFPVPDLGPEK